ncbi:invasion associated locus B family protein [Cognatiyoonia sp.]|uniref:invasion associated locus B family protein n=1 Tax=Cognatiyoonia sp. TaxID=2211652 RepID=UPI003F69EAE4
MFKPISASLLAATLFWGSALVAQDATDDAEAVDESGLSLGEEVQQAPREPQVGEPFIGDVFGDWALRCLKAEPGRADPCQLYQLVNDDDGNSVAEISIFPIPNGNRAAAGATLVVPLETLLTQQVTLTIDGGTARRYPFTFCNAAGCVARVGFTAEEVALFKRGNNAEMRLVAAAAPDSEVKLDISLTGFTAGYDSLETQ